MCAIWLSHILSRADHRLNQVRAWAEQLPTTLASFLSAPLRPTDLTDDRLADVLRMLSDDTRWAAYEGDLNGNLLRVYDLHPTTVRVDSTTASGYWEVTEDGLFPFGHSKDHRPDLPQVKVMLSTLDPLGMPLAADVVPGQRTDDPLYLPTIARVRASLGRTGLLYIGDCKLGTVGNRAGIHRAGDHYLCPLSAVQLPAAILAALVEAALAEVALARPATLPTVTRLGDNGKPIVIATGTEDTITMTGMVDDEPVTWVERRVLVRSQAHAVAQARGLWRRVEQVEVDLVDLLVARRGKVRPLTPTDLEKRLWPPF